MYVQLVARLLGVTLLLSSPALAQTADLTLINPQAEKAASLAREVQESIDQTRSGWQQLESDLQQIEVQISQLNPSTMEEYDLITQLWRQLFDLSQTIAAPQKVDVNLIAQLESLEESLESQQPDQELINNNLEQLLVSLEQLDQEASKKYESHQRQAYQLFARAARKRAVTIHNLDAQGNEALFAWSERYFKDVLTELKSIPLRWIGIIELKIQKFKSDLTSGIDGWLEISKEAFFLFAFVILGLFSFRLFSRLSGYLDKKREILVRRSFKDISARRMALWLHRTSPYLPWVGVVLYFEIGQAIMAQTYFSELAIIFPYLNYYAYYRISRILITQLLSSYSLFGSQVARLKNREKLISTSKFLARYIFISIAIIHTVRSAAGEGFVFMWLLNLSRYLFIAVLAALSYRWSQEILQVALKTFPAQIHPAVEKALNGRLAILWSLPIALLTLAGAAGASLLEWSERFEVVRSLSAQIFRKKVEGIKADERKPVNTTIPKEYVSRFSRTPNSLDGFLSQSQKNVFEQIHQSVMAWQEDSSEDHVVAIVGEKGAGKSYLLQHLATSFESLTVKEVSFSHKMTNTDELNHSINLVINDSCDKMLVIVDQAENLFLSKVGGFESFKAFLRLTQENMKDIFWCVSFNSYSWEFLQAVLNKTRYFNSIYRLEKWKDEEIKQLILAHHAQTGAKMKFDEILMATRSDDSLDSAAYIETKFFRLLWEESLGNPLVAQSVWLHCLSGHDTDEVKVGLPRDRVDAISGLPDDFYFVLSSVVRHDNLSVSEIKEATDLSEDLISNAMKVYCERGYLKVINRRLHLSPLWQHSVYSTLRRKNFIYGN